MKNSVRTTVVFLFFAALAPEKASAQNLLEQINEAPLLTLNEFLTQTGKNTFFEEILIDTLDLKYSEVLALPAEDVVLGVKGAYQVLFPSESDSKPSHGLDSSVSLSKGVDFSLRKQRTHFAVCFRNRSTDRSKRIRKSKSPDTETDAN